MSTNDVIQIINVLSEKLGTTAENLYAVLIEQAKVYAVKGILLALLSVAIVCTAAVFTWQIFFKPRYEINGYSEKEKVSAFAYFNQDIDSDGKIVILVILEAILLILAVIFTIVFFCIVSSLLNALINPDFWALDYILKALKQE